MRFFKYFLLIITLTLSFDSSAVYYTYMAANCDSNCTFTTESALFNRILQISGRKQSEYPYVWSGNTLEIRSGSSSLGAWGYRNEKTITCPSATEVTLKVAINAQKYQCVNQCQYALRGCVDIDFEPGMTCSAISTGIECGKTPPTPPKDPTDTSQSPDSDSVAAAPGQNSSNTNTNSATTTGSSTSTSNSTTTNNTTTNTSTTNTTTTTNINTTTKIDLSSLESAIESIGKLLAGKLDAIKEALGADSGSENGSPDGTDLTETNSK